MRPSKRALTNYLSAWRKRRVAYDHSGRGAVQPYVSQPELDSANDGYVLGQRFDKKLLLKAVPNLFKVYLLHDVILNHKDVTDARQATPY